MERLKPIVYFLTALLILLPFGVWGANVHFGHAHTLILVCLIALGAMLPNPYLCLFVFYVAAWLTYIVAGLFLGFLAAGATITVMLIDGSLWFILGTLVFLIIYNSHIKLGAVFNIICISAIIQAALGILQALGFDPIFDIARNLVTVNSELPSDAAVGTLGNNNFLAAFVAISLPFFFRRRWFYALPLLVVCLIFTKTTTAFIAAIVGTVYFFYPQIKSIKLEVFVLVCFVAAGAVISYAFFYHPFAENPRFDYWLNGLQQVAQSWQTILIGFGPTAEWKIGDKLHSEYVMALFNFGVIGLALLMGYIITICRTNRILFTAFIILCIDAIGNHVLHTIPTALLAITICSLIEHEKRRCSI